MLISGRGGLRVGDRLVDQGGYFFLKSVRRILDGCPCWLYLEPRREHVRVLGRFARCLLSTPFCFCVFSRYRVACPGEVLVFVSGFRTAHYLRARFAG